MIWIHPCRWCCTSYHGSWKRYMENGLNEDLEIVTRWATQHKFKLNPAKTKSTYFTIIIGGSTTVQYSHWLEKVLLLRKICYTLEWHWHCSHVWTTGQKVGSQSKEEIGSSIMYCRYQLGFTCLNTENNMLLNISSNTWITLTCLVT